MLLVNKEHLHGRGNDKRIAAHGRITVFLDAVFQRRGGRLLCAGMVGESPGSGSHCCVLLFNEIGCGEYVVECLQRREVEMSCWLPGT